MTDISRRRRLAGRALIGVAALALPLTASITYAEIPDAPEAPAAPDVPAATSAPAAPLAPDAPDAPLPPEAPDAPAVSEKRKVMVIRNGDGEHGEFRHELRDGKAVFFADGRELSEEEFRARMVAFGERMEGLEEELAIKLKDLPHFDEQRIRMIEKRAVRMAALAPEVRMSCEGEGATSETTAPDGKRVIRICERRIVRDAMHGAVSGLRRAREQIARNDEMSAEVRAEVLASLDQEIARLEAED